MLTQAQDAEAARVRNLRAALAGPLPHLEIAGHRAQRDRLDRIPHIDADARRREARNELIRGLDNLIAEATGVVAVIAGGIGLGASAHVVALFVGVGL